MSEKKETTVQGDGTELYKALFAVQQELEGVAKSADNDFYKSSYADRTSILQALRPLYAKHGLLLIQAPVVPTVKFSEEAVLALETTIVHVATGQSVSSTAIVPLPKADPQGFGSAVTYTSRYALTMIHGLPLLDDDGNSASGKGSAPRQSAPVQQKKDTTTKKETAKKDADPKPQTAAAGAEQTTSADQNTAKTDPPTAKTSTGSKPATASGTKRKLWGDTGK